ncbi:MAG: hypothetical protein L0Y54_00110 [Sporichthyaceae bacterium]|nr:hypothetical protein [Sporichthyaceae bacterium]
MPEVDQERDDGGQVGSDQVGRLDQCQRWTGPHQRVADQPATQSGRDRQRHETGRIEPFPGRYLGTEQAAGEHGEQVDREKLPRLDGEIHESRL